MNKDNLMTGSFRKLTRVKMREKLTSARSALFMNQPNEALVIASEVWNRIANQQKENELHKVARLINAKALMGLENFVNVQVLIVESLQRYGNNFETRLTPLEILYLTNDLAEFETKGRECE
jgi:hypothetical protein